MTGEPEDEIKMDNIDEEMSEESSSESEEESNEKMDQTEQQAFLPGSRIEPGEELVMDDQTYIIYHQANLGSPCLSFDVIPEGPAGSSIQYPLQVMGVAGTQASKSTNNNIILFKMTNLHPIKRRQAKNEDESDESDDENEEEVDEHHEKAPKLKMAAIKHVGCINRIRYQTLGSTGVVAAWSELSSVGIWSLDETSRQLDECRNFSITSPEAVGSKDVPRDLTAKPLFSFKGHPTEGFALDWCPTTAGVLASGDCKKNIHIWKPADGSASWNVDQRPLVGHTDSVEDIQWSPNEANVLASCSVDKSIRIWDCRAPPDKANMLTVPKAHDLDVNVISWNANEPFIASGGDEGHLKVWDLRTIDKGEPVAVFKHHRGPITSVDWHKTDSTCLASSGEDNQVALWDLAVERDNEEGDSSEADAKLKDLPPQLLFIHQGLEDVKEIRWHKQYPGVLMATSNTGFDVFKTISV